VAVGATCIVDTTFGAGAGFLRAWQTYAGAPSNTGLLHYVALAESAHYLSIDTTSASPVPAQKLAKALSALGVAGPLKQGFYRVPFEGGRVLLTLCIGPRATSLAQLVLQADHLVLDADAAWTERELHGLQTLARRGTTLFWVGASNQRAVYPKLDARLWKPHKPLTWVFAPAWALRRSRSAHMEVFAQAGRCTIIGAGISGALVARALALRGWQVTVLEKLPKVGAGASGLPAGLVSVSGDSAADPLLHLTRSGYHLTRHLLQSMLAQGDDWDEGGALRAEQLRRHRLQRKSTRLASTQQALSPTDASHSMPWHPEALWVKPQAWIRACLATPGGTLRCETEVDSLRHHHSQWTALDANGQELARSELLVLCNALDAARLLPAKAHSSEACASVSPAVQQALAQLHPMYGSISSGPADGLPDLPALPVHGQGHFLPAVAAQAGLQWVAGAGFETDDSASDAACHQGNLARVAALVPALTVPLQAQYAAGQLALWRGQRCVSHDRLPLVGLATVGGDKGLWMCLAMGARGLTFASLCAELLAARLMGEPLPLPRRLARLLDAQRLQHRSTHQTG
jgi:tRNA 5-methylaminomethyl-2-thiouridine biosynthesis bifunctional protein